MFYGKEYEKKNCENRHSFINKNWFLNFDKNAHAFVIICELLLLFFLFMIESV